MVHDLPLDILINLHPPLDELDGEELLGPDVPDQLGHPEVARSYVLDHLVPLHRHLPVKLAPWPSSRLVIRATGLNAPAGATEQEVAGQQLPPPIGQIPRAAGPMGGADCGGRDEATEERGVEGSRRWGQRRGRWKVRECGVEGKEG
jgi:hypothetical protein